MKNFTMNCIFNADSTDMTGAYVGSFNANYDNGNIYYNMNVMNAIANQDEVAKDFEDFKTEVFNCVRALKDSGFITIKSTTSNTPPVQEEEENEDELDESAV
jgi:hypothetical protein